MDDDIPLRALGANNKGGGLQGGRGTGCSVVKDCTSNVGGAGGWWGERSTPGGKVSRLSQRPARDDDAGKRVVQGEHKKAQQLGRAAQAAGGLGVGRARYRAAGVSNGTEHGRRLLMAYGEPDADGMERCRGASLVHESPMQDSMAQPQAGGMRGGERGLINSQIDVLAAREKMDECDCPGTQAVTCISAQRWLEQFRVGTGTCMGTRLTPKSNVQARLVTFHWSNWATALKP